MVKTEAQHRAEILRFGRALQERNFSPSTSGNISVRLDQWRILITPTGISKGAMTPEDLIVVSPEGKKRFGRRNPSSEIKMHLQIYRERPDINAVVHAHPPKATAFACAGIALDKPIASEIVMTLGTIPVAAYGTPGSPDLSAALEGLIPGHSAILMANHGVVTYGRDLAEAHGKMDLVEHFAEITLGTYKLDKQNLLSHDEVKKLHEASLRYASTVRED